MSGVRILILMVFALILATGSDARTILRVEGPASGRNLLAAPDFEQTSGWKAFGKGFSDDAAVRRSGKASIRCENTSADTDSGAFQTITLNQKSPHAIRATAWSRAEGTGKAWRGDYALYLDIQYDDGSWVWGQAFNFDSGTHDWQQGEVLFQPEKPIKVVNVYLLFRKCMGKVWFDDCHFEQISPSGGQALFDNVVVRKSPVPPPVERLRTADGLKVSGFFFVRDVAAGSDFMGLEKMSVAKGNVLSGRALDVKLDARITSKKDHVRFDCEAEDVSGKDRAVTIGFAVPMPKGDWTWWRSIRSNEKVSADGIYCDSVPIEAGIGAMSKYPFSCMSAGDRSLCLGIPMSEPCVYRIGYNGALRWHTISFDLGFRPEQGVTKQRFSFIIYWSGAGMRSAVEKYYRIFPEYFVKRVEREGNWMAFTRVSGVRDWRDFGFAYHEGDNDIEWDAANGICSFRYTEPMSHWRALAKDIPRTTGKMFEILDADLKGDDAAKRDWASAVKSSLAHDGAGDPRVFFFDAPWCDGAMFLLNPCPRLPLTPELPVTKATHDWGAVIAQGLYGDPAKPRLAGEYLDSCEMGGEYVNTRREHLGYAIRPLSFTVGSKQPCILQQLSTYEFASWMAEDVHKRGKLMMANCIPSRFGFMAHLFDVLGTETNWLADGEFHPMSDDAMDFRRTLCGRKPYCFLMNTDYRTFDHAMVEKYMQRCLFWAMFPGFFSPNAATGCYFDDPQLYDRDRDLFVKYMPVIKAVAGAGWQPITMARTSDPRIECERFGPGKDGALYFTVRSNADAPTKTVLRLDPKLGRPKSAVKLPGDEHLTIAKDGIEVLLAPDEVAAIEVRM